MSAPAHSPAAPRPAAKTAREIEPARPRPTVFLPGTRPGLPGFLRAKSLDPDGLARSTIPPEALGAQLETADLARATLDPEALTAEMGSKPGPKANGPAKAAPGPAAKGKPVPAERPGTGKAAGPGGPRQHAEHREELTEELEPAPAAEAVAELGPLALPVPEGLARPAFEFRFDAPAALDASGLKLPPASQKTPKSELDGALSGTLRAYAAAARTAKDEGGQVARATDEVITLLLDAYARATGSVPAAAARADDAVAAAFDRAESGVELAADAALATVEQRYRTAQKKLGGAAGGAHAAIKANVDSADAQITAIVNGLASGVVKTVDNAAKDCADALNLAVGNINAWALAATANFPVAGKTGEAAAENESKQAAAPKIAGATVEQLNNANKEVSKSFAADKVAVDKNVRAAIEPPLKKRAEEMSTKGNASVNAAHASSLKTLNEQAKEARKATAQMRSQARAQLAARRRAARAQIESTGKRALADARSQARGAAEALAGAMRASLPLYVRSTLGLKDAISKAAAGGPRALQETVEKAGPESERNARKAGAEQNARLLTTRDGASEGLAKAAEGAEADTRAAAGETEAQMAGDVATTGTSMIQAAEAHTKGFNALAGAIGKAAESWTAPLKKTFADFPADSKTNLTLNLKAHKEEIDGRRTRFVAEAKAKQTPATAFEEPLKAAWTATRGDLSKRLVNLTKALDSGIIDKGDERGITSALRGVTSAQGSALIEMFAHSGKGSLVAALDVISGDDYAAAINYLYGNTAIGAKYELAASLHWYNDQEDRIEEVMRSLSPEELEKLHRTDGWYETASSVRSALDGTDLKVFDALNAGKPARADALRMRDKLKEARESGDDDAMTKVLEEYSSATTYAGDKKMAAEERRAAVQREFAHIEGAVDLDKGEKISEVAAQNALLVYATRDVQVEQSTGEGDSMTLTLSVKQEHKDLAEALIKHGTDSKDARAAQIGVELKRPDKPDILKVDAAVVDPRLNPNNYPGGVIPPETKTAALAERAEIMRMVAEKQGAPKDVKPADFVAQKLGAAFGEDTKGGQLAAALVKDETPSPETAALAMDYAMDRVGTDEELIHRTLGRMNRDQIAQMRIAYGRSGKDLYKELGVYGADTYGEVSGDDRLQVERELLGVPRNDQEKAQVAGYAIRQQRKETGPLGRALADGTLSATMMDSAEADLDVLTGGMTGGMTFDKDGLPQWTDSGDKFDKEGKFKGDAAKFSSATILAQGSAENYAAKVDSYASAAVTTIAVIGAIVATVATAGGAGPLVLAGIAAGGGLAGMGAHAMISGGRYGWEQATTDLGMTAVQALTAGVGAQMGVASRGGSAAIEAAELAKDAAPAMGRLTGTAFGDMVLIGATSGGLNSLGSTALEEKTWEKGIASGIGTSLFGGLKGAAGGAAAAGVSSGLEAVKPGRIPVVGKLFGNGTVGESIAESRNLLGRGAGKALVSGSGAFASKGVELSIDKAAGHYHGDAGDIFQAMGEAGGQAAIQGFGEGSADAAYMRIKPRLDAWKARRAAEKDAAARPATPHEEPPELIPVVHDTGEPPDLIPVVHSTEETPAKPAPEPPTSKRPMVIPEPAVELPGPAAPKPAAEAPAAPEPLPPTPRPTAEISAAPEPVTAARPAPDTAEMPALRPAAGEPAPVIKGEAAQLPGTAFHAGGGGSQAAPVIHAQIETALPRITGAPVHTENGAPVARLALPDGKAVSVRIETEPAVGSIMELRQKPVAHFEKQPDGTYLVRVSEGARPEHIERALAHELAEIRHIESGGRTDESHALLAGSKNRELTAHDVGRVAELEVISRQIAEAPPGSEQAARLRADGEALASHLGLVHGGETSKARLGLLEPHLSTEGRATLETLVTGASQRGLKPGTEGLSGDAFTTGIHEAHVRERFGDLEHFQEFGEFKSKYRAGNPKSSLSDAKLFKAWAGGAFVGPEGNQRSLAAAKSSRVPDVRARGGVVEETGATVEASAARPLQEELTDAQARQRELFKKARQADAAGESAEAVQALTDQANALQAEVNTPTRKLGELAAEAYAGARPDADELRPLPMPKEGSGVPDRVFEKPDGTLVIVEAKGTGSDKPLESALGVRAGVGASKGLLVQQGTREYLESLAAELSRPNAPDAQRALGKKIADALARPGGVEFVVVVQRINADTSLGKVEAKGFDVSRSAKVPSTRDTPPAGPASGLIKGEAAHIPGSSFHAGGGGEVDVPATKAAVAAGISNITRNSPGSDDRPGVTIRTADGRLIDARVETEVLPASLKRELKKLETMPVARHERNPDGSYVIKVSAEAARDHVERAVAHELGVIEHLTSGRSDWKDVLHVLEPGSDASKFTSQDMGKIAELAALDRLIRQAGPGSQRAAKLQADGAELAVNLGLVNGGDEVTRRLQRLIGSYPGPGQRANEFAAEARRRGGFPVIEIATSTTHGRPLESSGGMVKARKLLVEAGQKDLASNMEISWHSLQNPHEHGRAVEMIRAMLGFKGGGPVDEQFKDTLRRAIEDAKKEKGLTWPFGFTEQSAAVLKLAQVLTGADLTVLLPGLPDKQFGEVAPGSIFYRDYASTGKIMFDLEAAKQGANGFHGATTHAFEDIVASLGMLRSGPLIDGQRMNSARLRQLLRQMDKEMPSKGNPDIPLLTVKFGDTVWRPLNDALSANGERLINQPEILYPILARLLPGLQ